MERRVVITGLGAVCGLGVGIGPLWEGLLAGRSGLRRIRLFDPAGFPCRIGAEVPGFTGAKDYVPKSYRKAVKVMARDIELAVAAAKLAVEDARLVTRGTLPEGATDPTTYPNARMGCHIGAGLIAAETTELTTAMATAAMSDVAGDPDRSAGSTSDGHPTSDIRRRLDLRAWGDAEGGAGAMNNLPPLWLLKYLPNMLACHVTIIHGAEGPSNTITCAEASGLLSIGESLRVIERGDADLCFSGGAESPINHMRLLRMEMTGRLAHTGDAEDGAAFVRPYDAGNRGGGGGGGGLLGEGGGILIVEALDTATGRGARAYAEIAGFGAAHSAPPRDGWIRPAGTDLDEGTQYAIENALDDAGLRPDQIDAIIPHASGTPAFDSGEAGALRAVFGGRLREIPLVTLTPSLGDCMASSGGLAVAIAAKCLSEQKLPARLHAGTPPPDLQAGPSPARETPLRHILVATGALGGQNAALILRRAPEPSA
ncbi:MAG: beta-ketoacyl synthase N-terminal-like domain-containing protein [Phycisphaerales bacterium]